MKPAAAANSWSPATLNLLTQDLQAVAYDGSTWIAISVAGEILQSDDGGVTWNGNQSAQLGDATGIAYGKDTNGNPVWDIVCKDGKIYSSPNGVFSSTSQPVLDPGQSNLDLESITWDGTEFIAVGGKTDDSTGYFLASSDGVIWNVQPYLIGSDLLYNVKYVGGKLLAVGSSGQIFSTTTLAPTTASDWDTGTTDQNVSSQVLWGSTYDSHTNMFVAVGDSGTVLTSSDAKNWTLASSSVIGSSQLYSIAYGGNKLVAVGASGKIFSLTDGQTTWSDESPSGGIGDLYSVIYGGNKFVAVGGGPVIETQIATLSADASLSDLQVSGTTLGFSTSTTAYTVNEPYSTTSVTIIPTTEDSNATVTVNGHAVSSGSSSNVSLNTGDNPITVVVTAEDGTTTQTYTVTVTRAKSSNADLSNLTLSQGTLSPTFASDTIDLRLALRTM